MSARSAASSSSATRRIARCRRIHAGEIIERLCEIEWEIKALRTDVMILKKWLRGRYSRH